MSESIPGLRFEIDLEPTGDHNSTLRYRNAPDQIERPTLVDRHTSLRSDLSVQGSLVTVVHGELNFGGPKATLIVAQFQFMGSQHSRRFCSASVCFQFQDEKNSLSCSVHKIAPSGEFALNPSFSQQETKLSVGMSAGVNAIATASGQTTYELGTTFDRQDRGSFYGTTKTEGRNYGPKNTAKWSMSQNKTQKSGIPTVLNLAILLQRENDDRFFAHIKVAARVDIMHTLENGMRNVCGSNRIDPIIFDPRGPGMGHIPKGLDPNCLLSYPLPELGGIESTPVLST